MNKTELVELISKGFSTREISLETGKSQTTVRYWLDIYDLKTVRQRFNKHIARKCSFCGETDLAHFYKRLSSRCKKCHNKDTAARGKKTRDRLIEHMGGKCHECSFDKYKSALQVHHTDGSKKDPSFGSHRGWTWERILEEITDCVLLCANCHLALHAGEMPR